MRRRNQVRREPPFVTEFIESRHVDSVSELAVSAMPDILVADETITLEAFAGFLLSFESADETITIAASSSVTVAASVSISESITLGVSCSTTVSTDAYFEEITLAASADIVGDVLGLDNTFSPSVTASLTVEAANVLDEELSLDVTASCETSGANDPIFTDDQHLLSFTQAVTARKIITIAVEQTLTFTQSANRNTAYVVSVVQTLEFKHGKIIPSPLNGTPIFIPGANYELVPRKCFFRLYSSARTILLPCPLFGDGELQTGTVNIKRTIWGDRYSYIRQPLTKRLQYTFTVDTQKRIELEDFLENYSSQLVDFENHKGERWKAFIVNMPLVHESRGRYMPRNEKFDISLEFEGVKIS